MKRKKSGRRSLAWGLRRASNPCSNFVRTVWDLPRAAPPAKGERPLVGTGGDVQGRSGLPPPFHATEQRPPESARPERGVDRVSSACVGPRAPWRRRCAPIAWRALHPSERVHVTVSEAVGKRTWSASRDPASASRGSRPGFALSWTHVDRPARDRGRWPSRAACSPLGVHRHRRGVRLRRCLPRGRAPAGPVRRRGGSGGGCRANDGVTARAAEFAASTGRGRARRGTWLRLCTRAQALDAGPLREVCALIADRCRQSRRRRGRCP